MTLQSLKKQALNLPSSDRWHLVQFLLDTLKQEAQPITEKGNLSRLRGIAKKTDTIHGVESEEDYVTYLTKKYQ